MEPTHIVLLITSLVVLTVAPPLVFSLRKRRQLGEQTAAFLDCLDANNALLAPLPREGLPVPIRAADRTLAVFRVSHNSMYPLLLLHGGRSAKHGGRALLGR